jgi:hypothetical protein
MQFGTATVSFMNKTAALQGRWDKANLYGALSECCTVLWGLSAEWHCYKLAEIPNKYRNLFFVLQAQTRQICRPLTSCCIPLPLAPTNFGPPLALARERRFNLSLTSQC